MDGFMTKKIKKKYTERNRNQRFGSMGRRHSSERTPKVGPATAQAEGIHTKLCLSTI
jgi:hypothetical protein